MVYQKPTADIVQFDNSDIITASGTNACRVYAQWCDEFVIRIIEDVACAFFGAQNSGKSGIFNGAEAGPRVDPFADI